MFGGGRAFTLFRVRGIRITADWSWFVVLFLVIFWLSDFYGEILDQPGASTEPFLLAVASAIGFFGSIVLHELGHALVALRNGIGISKIQLWIFGGVAQLDRESDTPGNEFKVAVGGPLVTFLISVALIGIGVATVGWDTFRDAVELRASADTSAVMTMVAWLAAVNVIVLFFNLLPAFPMDGGRIIFAIAWRLTGTRNKAMRFAATLGRLFGYLFIGLGIVWAMSGQMFSGVWLALIGFLITGSARGAMVDTKITSRLEGKRVSDVMDSSPVAIPATTTLDRALEEYFLRYDWSWFPVTGGDGQFLGMIVRDRVEATPEVERAGTTASELLEERSSTFQVSVDAQLETLLGNPGLRRFGALMVTDATGRLAGVITIEQLGRALRP